MIHDRFVRRLVGLARRQFARRIRTRADHEGVVQSVFRSFFSRFRRGELIVRSLTIDGTPQPAGTYTASNSGWIKGKGKVIVQP